MMANNEIGTVEPIEELARIAHAHGALIHTDAVQAVGHIPIDVNALGVDLLSASAHKFNGPKGIGFLYIRRGTSIHPFADGGAQEFGMRAGTENVAAIVGMSVALKKNCDHMVEIGARLHKLEQVFLGTLQQAGIDFVRNGSENRVPGNISISIRGASGEMLLHRLDLKDNADTIEGNCDTTLFLGGKEKTTLKEIAEILGKETIDLYNTSDTRGSQRSYGMNYQKTGKELMSQDEIAVMDGGKCILQVRGVRPFFSNKYDICKHKNYKYLSDYDKKNTFDIEKYLSTNLILKPEDEVELYQM